MKKFATLLCLALSVTGISHACTTFFINRNGQLVFGRNYDWITGNGMVFTNQKGLAKTSDKTIGGETISWVSLYGSITFNQYGKEFPTGGMNEKGLVVEMMWLDGTTYPAADQRPAVGVLQWIQYQLDNCATVDELIASDRILRISDNTPLHYLVADATGNAATIEFLDGKMIVHQGSSLPFPVLTNDTYKLASSETQTAANQARSFTNNSIERFAKACSRIEAYHTKDNAASPVDYSFGILQDVAQGSHTKWSIVYDITHKKIYFKTLDFPTVKHIAFSDFNFQCTAIPKAWDMNQPGQGDIAAAFANFSLELNSKLVNRSFDESSSQFTVGEEGRRETWQYAGRVSCK